VVSRFPGTFPLPCLTICLPLPNLRPIAAWYCGGKPVVTEPGTSKFQIDLRRHLRQQNICDNLVHLICEIAEAGKYVINAVRTGDLGVAGTSNLYGEEQLALDVLSDRIIKSA
jgi:hypothetical protein